MSEYHKIQTIFKRDPNTKYKNLIDGDWSLPEFGFLSENNWVWTEKVDGTNIRIIFDGENITFGGRTDRAHIPAELLNELNDLFLPKADLFKEKFPDGAVLYGEGYGNKIQKVGNLYRPDQSFVLFDVNIGGMWLKEDSLIDIVETFNIDIVPVVGEGTIFEMIDFVRNGFNSRWGDFSAEGIVARPKIELLSRNGKRIITKLKTRDFD